MPISDRTRQLVERRWRAFCEAVKQAEVEHGAPVEAYFGESQVICDSRRLRDHHDQRGGVHGGLDFKDGGAILLHLPRVKGFHQDGGGW